jgi:hypothetical protein
MAQNKFGEDMPQTEQEYKEELFELKRQYFYLHEQGAPISEAEPIRAKAKRLQSWWKHFTQTSAGSQDAVEHNTVTCDGPSCFKEMNLKLENETADFNEFWITTSYAVGAIQGSNCFCGWKCSFEFNKEKLKELV